MLPLQSVGKQQYFLIVVIEFFVIFGGLAGCVEPTMRWLVG
jgi:hypothetical protein